MAEELVSIHENDYNELLLQTIAVIEHARIKVGCHVAATESNTYWERFSAFDKLTTNKIVYI